ncbi:hypothetical protein ACIP4Y_34195 [Streptomyces sp. NPDC088810]|uniref:hypothetical protein n=1 Tax=Streptomyces sp. NPDC088810 TaxID=3365904 RepID=UPI003813CE44
MRRTNITLCLFSAERRLLLAQRSRPVLLAVVEEDDNGVEFRRTDAYRSPLPPLRAGTGRALAGHPDRWAHRFAAYLFDAPGGALRRMPDPGDGRVKAYRKQARDGTLPPVLLWWVSGLDCHLILDGHAQLAAAIAESVSPPLLHLHRTAPREDVAAGTERAVHR